MTVTAVGAVAPASPSGAVGRSAGAAHGQPSFVDEMTRAAGSHSHETSGAARHPAVHATPGPGAKRDGKLRPTEAPRLTPPWMAPAAAGDRVWPGGQAGEAAAAPPARPAASDSEMRGTPRGERARATAAPAAQADRVSAAPGTPAARAPAVIGLVEADWPQGPETALGQTGGRGTNAVPGRAHSDGLPGTSGTVANPAGTRPEPTPGAVSPPMGTTALPDAPAPTGVEPPADTGHPGPPPTNPLGTPPGEPSPDTSRLLSAVSPAGTSGAHDAARLADGSRPVDHDVTDPAEVGKAGRLQVGGVLTTHTGAPLTLGTVTLAPGGAGAPSAAGRRVTADWTSPGFSPPAPDATRPSAPPAQVDAWLEHPTTGPLQVSFSDDGATVGVRLSSTVAGVSALLDSSGALQDILDRAVGGQELPAPAAHPVPEEGEA